MFIISCELYASFTRKLSWRYKKDYDLSFLGISELVVWKGTSLDTFSIVACVCLGKRRRQITFSQRVVTLHRI